MPHDIRIIRIRDFVRLDAAGHYDFQATRQLLSDTIWACVRSQIAHVMLDVREATAVELTAAQLTSLAHVCQEVKPAGGYHAIAIVTGPHERLDRAAFVATAAQREGWNIRAFDDFEAACMWLCEEPAQADNRLMPPVVEPPR